MLGTWVNIITVLVGGITGSLLGDRLPPKTRETVMSGLGLMSMLIGLQMAMLAKTTPQVLIVLISILLGAVLGEWWGLEKTLERFGKRLEALVSRRKNADHDEPISDRSTRSIARAFVTSSLVFCVGPMSIIGSIQDGLKGDHSLLFIKSILDGFTSLAFGAALGPGVVFSTITILLFQGGISLGAMGLAGSLSAITSDNPAVVLMTATGGVIIMGISLILLDIKQVRVGKMLPAIFIAPLLVVMLKALHITA